MTTTSISIERQRQIVATLGTLASDHAEQLRAIDQACKTLQDSEQRLAADEMARVSAEFEKKHAQQIATYKQQRDMALARYEHEGIAVFQAERTALEEENTRHTEAREVMRTVRQHAISEVQEEFRKAQIAPKVNAAQFQQQCEYSSSEVSALVVKAQSIVRRRCDWPESPPAPRVPGLFTKQQCVDRYTVALAKAYEKVHALQHQPSARVAEDGWPILIGLFTIPILGYPAWLLVGEYGWWVAAILTVFVASLVAVAVVLIMRPIARRETLRLVPEFQAAIDEARDALMASLEASRRELAEEQQRILAKRDTDTLAAKSAYKQSKADEKLAHQANITRIINEAENKRLAIENRLEPLMNKIEQTYPPQITELEVKFAAQLQELAMACDAAVEKAELNRQSQVTTANAAMKTTLATLLAESEAMQQRVDQWCPPLSSEALPTPAVDVEALRLGEFQLELPRLDAAAIDPSTLDIAIPASLRLPAVLSYPSLPSLLIKAEEEGRDQAARVIQAAMLRLLATFPPGKVRFTIIDPVGLGENFSALMHLADFDERLVHSRIWTESNHIQQRLADLTAHMENVIQKYLRNEFDSIQQYNQQAGEVAEAYQILVIANFPANFSEEAVRRLLSITASGARCGVFTLIGYDRKLKSPRPFDEADLGRSSHVLEWDSKLQQFRSQMEGLTHVPLVLDTPPSDEESTAIIRTIGQRARHAARVEVPFSYVIPGEEKWWTGDSRSGIDVPLGRAGAKNLQYMRLGKGTSQHVLISGKTGSGKSTLLNAIITNLALHYSPDELEFFLIDFKKGVEFKAYATCRLPHARVIAIESEREFGMSVLERLDLELKRRGDLFRQKGTQDLASFRSAAPEVVMPRVLLVIDEFQEFFTSDDRVSHDAALLLDRLVRQGRAFGIHVLLGSQTLSGAYSLARSTIGQMAVRVALQCSESDAHLILSEDNTAARLLSRPGEAIYNDANGLVEGNHPFQVVWLPDEEREHYLTKVRQLCDTRGTKVGPPIVFEGSAAADVRDNNLLRAAIETPASRQTQLSPRLWLGAAVAVKDPTSITLRRGSGANLLIVGQNEELATGMMSAAILALASQTASTVPATTEKPPQFSKVTLLDGARPDTTFSEQWKTILGDSGIAASTMRGKDAVSAIAQLADEVQRRLDAGEHHAETLLLVIHDLSRFRDLKKSDDFGMSFGESSEASVSARLATLLREGPAVGIHTIVWADSYNSVNRWFERGTIRDFEYRALFQMSATDSANLMDSPGASKLGNYLAYLYSEESGQAERMRPYGIPDSDFLREFRQTREKLSRHAELFQP